MKKKPNQNLNLRNYVSSFLVVVYILIVGSLISCTDQSANATKNEKDSIPAELKKLNEEIINHPEVAENFYKRSVYFYQHVKYADAMEDIGKAINMEPENPLYHFRIGEYLFALNQTKKSAMAFEKAVELKPDYIEALQKLGELYLIVKEYGKSDSCWHRLYELDKTNSKAAYFRGLMYKDKGDSAKAVQSFQYAAELEEKFVEPRLQLGIIYAAKNNPACLAYFDAVLKLQPKSWEAYMARGDYYRRRGNNALAIKDLDQVLYYNPTNFMANYHAGVIFYSEKKYKNASDQFSNVIAKNPDYTFAYFSRALCYQKMNDINHAVEDLKTVIRMDSTYIEAKKLLKELNS